jgi:NAD(P)-dependent dehydrogenase (short-subunit alcohol dehydrogenase family)
MKSFSGKIAVITGAGSGIGLGIARRCAREHMNLVLVDIEQQALELAQQELDALGSGSVIVRQLDVSDAAQVATLATEVFEQYGAVHLLVNNAGVGGGGRNCWELDIEYWQWVLGVNLWGVIHGIKYFTPAMLKQSEGHIVNTASVAGLMSAPGSAAYNVSKHGVVTLSETLHGELRNASAAIGVSVLCPSYVDTRIYAAERNSPQGVAPSEEQQAMEAAAGEFFSAVAMSTEKVADKVFEAIIDKRFYVLTHPGIKQQVDKRMQAIINDGAPEFTGAEDFPLD